MKSARLLGTAILLSVLAATSLAFPWFDLAMTGASISRSDVDSQRQDTQPILYYRDSATDEDWWQGWFSPSRVLAVYPCSLGSDAHIWSDYDGSEADGDGFLRLTVFTRSRRTSSILGGILAE